MPQVELCDARRRGGEQTTLALALTQNDPQMTRRPMITRRSILFFCLVLSGVSLDAYWTWYSFHFEAACSATSEKLPGTYVLFTAISLIPATASLIFRHNRIYVLGCLGLWLLHVYVQAELIIEVRSTEGQFGVNCYRDVGGGTVVAFAETVFFSATVLAITLLFGVVELARKWLRRASGQVQ